MTVTSDAFSQAMGSGLLVGAGMAAVAAVLVAPFPARPRRYGRFAEHLADRARAHPGARAAAQREGRRGNPESHDHAPGRARGHGLSIEAVAAEAGVGKTTIYRRWQTKEDLVVAALARMRPPPEPPPDTGSLEGDLTTLSEAQIARVAGTKLPWVAPRVLSEAMGDPEFHARVMHAFINPIRELLGKLVRRAIERGELATDTDVDQAIDLIHAMVIFRVLMSAGDLSRSFGEMTRIRGSCSHRSRPSAAPSPAPAPRAASAPPPPASGRRRPWKGSGWS